VKAAKYKTTLFQILPDSICISSPKK